MADVLVVGCGLIGTSIGLALRGELDVVLHDRASSVLAQAAARGAGRAWDRRETATTAVVAVPPGRTAGALKALQDRDLAQTYTHVASVQSQVQREIEFLKSDLSSIVGGHPLAGRESSGPSAATADLFVGRPWAVCPNSMSRPEAVSEVRRLAQACGAHPVEIDADGHDASVALLSHLPQVAASALAGLLAAAASASDPNDGSPGAPGRPRDGNPAVLSGPGLVDTTRLAASDPELWTEILQLNAAHVAPLVRDLAAQLTALADALGSKEGGPGLELDGAARVRSFLEQGNRGRALVPVKRGELSDAFAPVRVSVDDRPGRLAALLTAAGDAGVNVEDVHVEHVPGRPTGVIELLVDVHATTTLTASLNAAGWHVLES